MYSVKKFSTTQKDLASIAFDIRNKVFVEEQKVDREEEYDSHEDESQHFLLMKHEQPIGTARWRFTDNGIKLERFAILKEHRNYGAGSFLVNEVLKDVLPHKKNIYLNAQVSAINVYARAGFVKEGEIFSEANIDHYKMTYKPENQTSEVLKTSEV